MSELRYYAHTQGPVKIKYLQESRSRSRSRTKTKQNGSGSSQKGRLRAAPAALHFLNIWLAYRLGQELRSVWEEDIRNVYYHQLTAFFLDSDVSFIERHPLALKNIVSYKASKVTACLVGSPYF